MSYTLVGFSSSNYYNKAKLAMLIAGMQFSEEIAYPGAVDLAASPLGKVPYLKCAEGFMCESQVIVDYVAQLHPSAQLYPSSPFATAKVKELCVFLDSHLELVARRLHPEALWGGKVSEGLKEVTKKELIKNIKAFLSLTQFSPYIAGDTLTAADCAAYCHLPLIRLTTKKIWGEDLLEAIDLKSYMARLNEHPAFARVAADAKADGPAFAAYMQALREKTLAAMAAKQAS